MSELDKWKAFRNEKQSRLNALLELARSEGRNFDVDENAEFLELEAHIANATAQIAIDPQTL